MLLVLHNIDPTEHSQFRSLKIHPTTSLNYTKLANLLILRLQMCNIRSGMEGFEVLKLWNVGSGCTARRISKWKCCVSSFYQTESRLALSRFMSLKIRRPRLIVCVSSSTSCYGFWSSKVVKGSVGMEHACPTYHASLFEVCAGGVVGLDETLSPVEHGDHQHPEGEHVRGETAHWLVLRLRGCRRRESNQRKKWVNQ